VVMFPHLPQEPQQSVLTSRRVTRGGAVLKLDGPEGIDISAGFIEEVERSQVVLVGEERMRTKWWGLGNQ